MCVHGKRWMCLCVSPTLTHLLFCLHSTLRCPLTPTWTAQRTVHSSEDKSGTVFHLGAYLQAFLSHVVSYERFGIATPSALFITLKRQWRVTRGYRRGETQQLSSRVAVQFSKEAAQRHYMTATEPPKLPFVKFILDECQSVLLFSCSLTLSLPVLLRDIFPGVKPDLTKLKYMCIWQYYNENHTLNKTSALSTYPILIYTLRYRVVMTLKQISRCVCREAAARDRRCQ